MLQLVAAILMMWFPIQEFLTTEVKKGLVQETLHPKAELRPEVSLTNALGMALTIA